MEKNIRVRFAPSPTGNLHIGSVRTALFNWLFARGNDGIFVLRIEDTDRERSTQDSINTIIENMKWLGLDWDEGPGKEGDCGPYVQSERLDIYREYYQKLLDNGRAYRCFCTQEDIEKKRQEARTQKKNYIYDRKCNNLSEKEINEKLSSGDVYSIRLKVDANEINFDDIIRGNVSFSNEFGDFIIVKSDGFPVYNFSVVVDDYLMGINYVIRGDDHISNTPRQIFIYNALGFEIPVFAHIPMILGEDGSRLSKRHGATSMDYYHKNGFLPHAMINYLVRLGWSYDETQEIFSLDELKEKFSLDKVSKKAAVFSLKKLLWLNAHYMKDVDVQDKVDLFLPALIKDGYMEDNIDSKDQLAKILKIAGERIRYYPDIIEYCDFFFIDKIEIFKKTISEIAELNIVTAIAEKFLKLIKESEFTADILKEKIMSLPKDMEIKPKIFYHILRIIITGKEISPDLFESILLLGKDRLISRFQHALEQLRTG